jgi:hypothetical protein
MTGVDVDLRFHAVSTVEEATNGSRVRYAHEGHPERPFRRGRVCP